MKYSQLYKIKNDRGYALLAMVIVIALISISLASSLDTYHADIVRDKEEEFAFRGEEMAKAIAKFNNGGQLMPLRSSGIFPTKLDELVKLTDINGKKMVFVRKYAMTDIFQGNDQWEPVRAGDPRIAEYIQNWSAYNNAPLPVDYLQFVGGSSEVINAGSAGTFLSSDKGGDDGGGEDGGGDDSKPQPAQAPTPQYKYTPNQNNGSSNNGFSNNGFSNNGSSNSGFSTNNGSSDTKGFSSSFNNNGSGGAFGSLSEDQRPIIGVVSKRKGNAYRRLFGKEVTYDKWLFIFMPVLTNQNQNNIPTSR